ncbi:peptide ABC transporter substrate-binding protein [Oscillochloris sp. ZM17-4]|uniref:peptide ABC transporter substrate-binding protein n=1 Tax=Oscillochloris sp. ZM17-4 TaxID=2866714 RepID=UPI001C7395E9|nr:peptide ABC transporter substrate-binding protein [Oscillochloris sp. ZM17-4]MBX0326909.1 peptide ABC transporter substrate-binding protein [Oscillochloris sp. ZM17-4]
MRPLGYIIAAALLALTACQVEGGVARPTTAAVGTSPISVETSAPAASAPTPSAAAVPSASDGSLRLGLTAEPGDLLPYHSDSADERITAPISELIFPSPLLALSYTYTTTGVLDRVPSEQNGDVSVSSADVFLDSVGVITTTNTGVITQVQQLSVTYRWNPDLRWADGTPVTADDSLFAYELAQKVSLGQEADSRLALLDRYERLDDHTTRAVLKPDFTDPAYITSYWTPLPRHLLRDVDPATFATSEFALLPVGYGPYTVDRRDPGNLRLKRNPHWPGPEPAAAVSFIFRDSVEMLRGAVSGGSLDVASFELPGPDVAGALKADAAGGSLVLTAVPSPIWEHIDFNLDVPLLQDIRVRRAIAQAIDRQKLVDTLLGGYGGVLESWIVPGQWASAPLDQLTRYPYSPDDANRMLDEAGYIDSDGDGLRELDGQPLTLGLVTTAGSPLRQAAADHITADLAAVGVTLDVRAMPATELYGLDGPLYRRNFDLALFAWIAGPDPRGWERWSCAGVPSEANRWTGNNFPGWCFFEADKAIRTATTAIDISERGAAYLRQQQLFTQELPVLPLFQRVELTISSPTIVGVRPDPTAPFTWNLAAWARK